MTINKMTGLASGMSFLVIAGSPALEATSLTEYTPRTSSPLPVRLTSHNFIQHRWPAPNPDHGTTLLDQTAPDDHAQSTFRPASRTLLAKALKQRIKRPQEQAFWRYPTTPLPVDNPTFFPVQMHGCTVAYSTDATTAKHLSQQLQQHLQNPNTDWDSVLPELTGDDVSIKLANQVLLRLPVIATELSHEHPHQLITRWTNNIRQVAGHQPLPLEIAQRHMYEVQETAQTVRGYASWYGPYFHGRLTANGEIYDQHALTAAHRDLPLGTFVKVINRDNGRSVIVRINDRGPYLDEENRIIDLSYRAAQILDGEHQGIVPIDLVVLEPMPAIDASIAAQPQTIALQP